MEAASRSESTAATVSIGVPVYNGARFLADSMETLLAQTYADIEFVISDNGSTDDTELICREFAQRDTRIRYLRYDENRGASWNYQNVVHQTSGPYFKWATHDALLAPLHRALCGVSRRRPPSSRSSTHALPHRRGWRDDRRVRGQPRHPRFHSACDGSGVSSSKS